MGQGGEERQPSISPMRLVAYASNRTGPWHIYVRSLSQDNSPDLTPDLEAAQSPVWSPDGQRLAFEATTSGVTSIYTSDPRGGSRVRVTNGESFDGQVSWAPDGKSLIYVIEREGHQAIVRLTLANSVDQEIREFVEGHIFDFGYSADGRSFAVTRGNWQHDVVLISDLGQR